jgi:hypothetical protein
MLMVPGDLAHHCSVELVEALHVWTLTSSTNIQVRGPLLTLSL